VIDDNKNCIASPIAKSEERMAARLAQFESTITGEFRKWVLPPIDPRVEAAACRASDLELEALLRVRKSGNKQPIS